MAVSPEFKSAMERLDKESNEMADKVRELRDTISTSMTQEEVNEATTFANSIADRLDATAKDPNAPVPPGPLPEL